MEYRKVGELKLWEDNPRKIDRGAFTALVKKIERWGQFKPLLVTPDGTVLGGNMRLRAYRQLGIEDIWVSVVHPKTDAERLEIALADNELAGRWDDDKLAELLERYKGEIILEDYAIDLGKPVSLDDLLNRYSPDIVEDTPPEVGDNPVSKRGEVYQLGRHRLMCGDSTKVEDVKTLMDGQKADMVFTDPPYNVDYGATMKDKLRGKDRKIMNDSFDTREGFYQFLYDAISALAPFVKGDVYICMSSSELDNLQKAFRDAGGHWSTFIIWVKNTFTMGRSNYQRQYEPILYGWFDGSSHYWSGVRNLGDVIKEGDVRVDDDGQVWLKSDAVPSDVWEFPKPSKSKEHPTMKPVALCARGVVNSSPPKGIVLDTFGGSGSTLIACEQADRICYTMELDPKYCDVIRKRYSKFIGKEDIWEKTTPSVKSLINTQ